jgi:hypothetical protein
MRRSVLLLLSAAAFAAAADNFTWDKVKELKSGSEVRIYEVGKPTPLEAKLDEVRDDDIVVVFKNEQKAIRKDIILRLDARPNSKRPVTTETKTTIDRGDKPGPPQGKPTEKPNIPGQTYQSGLTFGSKPAYETIYRKAVHGPTNAPPKQ